MSLFTDILWVAIASVVGAAVGWTAHTLGWRAGWNAACDANRAVRDAHAVEPRQHQHHAGFGQAGGPQ